MSDRNRLAEIIHQAICEDSWADCLENGYCIGAASAALTAGWRPPPRRIDSVAGLDALPPRAVVLDGVGDPWERGPGDRWWTTATDHLHLPEDLLEYGPVTVVRPSTGTARTGDV